MHATLFINLSIGLISLGILLWIAYKLIWGYKGSHTCIKINPFRLFYYHWLDKGYLPISAGELQELLLKQEKAIELIDIRDPERFLEKKIPQSINIPFEFLVYTPTHKPTKEKQTILICCHGDISQIAAYLLKKQGYTPLYSLRGGIEKWPYLLTLNS